MLTRSFGVGAALAILFTAIPEAAHAQYTVVHRFADGTQAIDGEHPTGLLTVSPLGIFGGTQFKYVSATRTLYGHPTIFNLQADGSTNVVKSFPDLTLDPDSLQFYKGGFVGTIYRGKELTSFKFGSIFRLSLKNGVWQNTWWHKFERSGPVYPDSPLIVGADGFLYGVAQEGGTSGRGVLARGAIYKLDPATHAVTTVYTFTSVTFQGPSSLMLANDGNYYGTTMTGNIFEMTPDGTVTLLYTFTNVGQLSPLIQGNDGNFYGTTSYVADGVVFKMTPNHVVSTLHTFGQGTDGQFPDGLVQGPTGNLYGTTGLGGSADGGTIYEIATDGSSYTILHNFGDGSVTNDGNSPGPLVVGSDNNLYGTTSAGGISNRGTIFKISP